MPFRRTFLAQFHERTGSVANSDSKSSFWQTFLLGLLALLPLALTILVIGWSAHFLQEFVGPNSVVGGVLTQMGLSFIDHRTLAYVLGILLVLIMIYVLGWLLEWRLGSFLYASVGNFVRRIPLVGNLYDLADRFVNMFGAQDDSAMKNMVPAWCFFGGDGATAVLALLPHPEPIKIDGYEYYAVLVPSAPVPVGGGLLFVPKDWVKRADFGIEALTSIYVTMGVTAPEIVDGRAGA